MFEGSQYFYYSMYLIGFVLMMIINLRNHDRYQISKKDAILYTLYTYVCGIVGAMIMGYLYNRVNAYWGFKTFSSVAIFGAVVFTPLLILLFPIQHRSWKNILDMLAPGVLIILTCAKFGCFINGCCTGIICNFGIHYPNIPGRSFPVQLFEVITMLLILGFTQIYFRTTRKHIVGMVYPVTFAFYCIARFFWEFFRFYPSEKMRQILLGLDFWQLVCCAVFIICVIFIIVLKKSNNSPAVKSDYE